VRQPSIIKIDGFKLMMMMMMMTMLLLSLSLCSQSHPHPQCPQVPRQKNGGSSFIWISSFEQQDFEGQRQPSQSQ
jgi:hypothetical protein